MVWRNVRGSIMAKQYDFEAEWIDVSESDLSADALRVYRQLREVRKTKAIIQAQFEQVRRDDLASETPAGSRWVFNYRFGKLQTAIVPDTGKSRIVPKARPSLAQYLDAQKARMAS